MWRSITLSLLLLAPYRSAEAQRRPGVPMGFYTTTGLVSADAELASVTSNNVLVEVPRFAGSLLVTAPVMKRPKRAWIGGLRVTPLSLGNNGGCVRAPGVPDCQNRRFTERVSLLTGGAFDIRSTVLRAMVGPALHSVERGGTRVGTQIRLDYGSPRLRSPTPILFLSYTALGSEDGDPAGITTFGVSFRWVRK